MEPMTVKMKDQMKLCEERPGSEVRRKTYELLRMGRELLI